MSGLLIIEQLWIIEIILCFHCWFCFGCSEHRHTHTHTHKRSLSLEWTPLTFTSIICKLISLLQRSQRIWTNLSITFSELCKLTGTLHFLSLRALWVSSLLIPKYACAYLDGRGSEQSAVSGAWEERSETSAKCYLEHSHDNLYLMVAIVILYISRGTSRNTLSIFDMSPTPTCMSSSPTLQSSWWQLWQEVLTFNQPTLLSVIKALLSKLNKISWKKLWKEWVAGCNI